MPEPEVPGTWKAFLIACGSPAEDTFNEKAVWETWEQVVPFLRGELYEVGDETRFKTAIVSTSSRRPSSHVGGRVTSLTTCTSYTRMARGLSRRTAPLECGNVKGWRNPIGSLEETGKNTPTTMGVGNRRVFQLIPPCGSCFALTTGRRKAGVGRRLENGRGRWWRRVRGRQRSVPYGEVARGLRVPLTRLRPTCGTT